jgi:hypothetical protein
MGENRKSSTFVIRNCTNTGSFILETLLTTVYSWTNNIHSRRKQYGENSQGFIKRLYKAAPNT